MATLNGTAIYDDVVRDLRPAHQRQAYRHVNGHRIPLRYLPGHCRHCGRRSLVRNLFCMICDGRTVGEAMAAHDWITADTAHARNLDAAGVA